MRIAECGILVESVRARSFPGVASDAPSASGVALRQYSEFRIPKSAFHPVLGRRRIMAMSAATFSPLRRKTYMSLFRFRH